MKKMLLALLVGAACSVPDDPNWSTLREGIRTLPPGVMVDARRWTANRNALEYFEIQSDDDVMTVWCGSPDGATDSSSPYRVSDILRCLQRPEAPTYEECIIMFVKEALWRHEPWAGTGLQCRPIFHDGYQHRSGSRSEPFVFPEWEPENIEERAVSEALVRSPKIPFWVLGVITVGVGGILLVGTGGSSAAFLPALCTLQAGTGPGCPSNPGYPPGDTPQPDGAQ